MQQNHDPQKTSALSPRGAIAQKIVQDCGLQDALGRSVCLSCANMVLAQDDKKRATMYCKSLFRDLEIAITACTDLTTNIQE